MSHRIRAASSIGAMMSFVVVPVALPAQVQPAQGPPAGSGNAEQLADVRSELREFAIGPEYADAPESVVEEGVPRGA